MLSPYFFSQDSRVFYLDFSPETRLPRTSWIDGESRLSSPFMGPFPYYSAMLNCVSDSESLTDSTSSSETAKRTRVRVDWCRDETNILLDCWGALYESLKSASVKQRKTLWSQILKNFLSKCAELGLTTDKNLEQVKKRFKNLEYEYRQVRTKMASTGEEGAKKLQAGCSYYSELDEILETQDAVNPDRMTISASSVVPRKSTSTKMAGNVVGETDRSVSPTANLATSDSQPSTSTPENSPPKPKETGESKKGPGQTPRRKRKRPSREDQDEDPYMTGICDMWRLSMEKQSERFEKSMELQQAAIQSQTEQTKALVAGLKDILKDCLKSD